MQKNILLQIMSIKIFILIILLLFLLNIYLMLCMAIIL